MGGSRLLFFFCLVPVLASALAACPTTPRADDRPLVEDPPTSLPQPLIDADASFREYLRLTRLSVVPPDAQAHLDVLRALIRWKTNAGHAAVEPFDVVLTRDADPRVAEIALLRLAVYQLNLGCEVSQLAPPAQMSASQQGVYTDLLDASAFKQITIAAEHLREAAALEGPHLTAIEEILGVLPRHDGEVAQSCRLTRDTWAPGETATIDELAQAACEAGEAPLCWVWAAWGGGGDPAWEAACAGDVARACLTLADRRTVYGRTQSDSAEATAAEALYEKACALGDPLGCRREFALYVPERTDAYRDACLKEGSSLDCVKLTRTLSPATPGRALWWACTSAAIAPDAEACAAGDALGCAARAFTLIPERRHEISLNTAPASDPAKAALLCGEGDGEACLAGATAYAESSRTCAGLLLLEACVRGLTDACGFLEP